ncbi:MAG: helicase-exonuclease AddAB subunit AddA, partial [Clostridiales bacterium]|nr:helicase-exonuclease AddAB subunit AddA [Clostridiales bacterium]
FYYQHVDEMLSDIKHTQASSGMLIELTLEFKNRYSQMKHERNLVDFNDLEHFALEILTYMDETGSRKPTMVADELCENFIEIMIDEYQDSNLVQEEILTSVSTTRYGKPNLFMVGDVKQSIYKFRMARPEIFMEKYNSYSTTDSNNQRIDLHKNFRSRENVLASINDVFYKIMSKDLGNIDYNDESALNTGAFFEEDDVEVEDRKSELILIDQTISDKEGNYTSSSNNKDFTNMELEAKVVANRIKELTNEETGLRVWDKKKQEYRLAQYKDIVILLRTVSGWADTFVNVLMEEGIPAFSHSQTGYFTTIEVQTVLSLLKIIDNPAQDIPLAGILRSPMVGISTKDLAFIKIESPKMPLYDAVKEYRETGQDVNLKDTLNLFLEELEEFRNMVPYTAIHDLITYILEKTNYRLYAAAMPAGEKRRANLDMLVEKAIAFEGTSYRGLFHFIRYIEKLQKYDVDFGEANLIGENDNTIRIMSVHKSKGLEFPIVFASGLGKKFNQQDANSKLVIHPDFGIGADYVDYEKRIKSPTLIKKVLQQSLRLENLGEELRVLYVDLTRAKEKLIMTGTVAKLEDRRKKWDANKTKGEKLAYSVLTSADNFLDWIVPALSENTCQIKATNPLEVIEMEKSSREITYYKKDALLNWDKDLVYDPNIKDEIEKRFSFIYGFQKEGTIQTKLSVSEIKKLSMEMDEETNYLFQEAEPILPKFLYGEQEETGADRGTAYHTVLESFDFSLPPSKSSIEESIENLIAKGKLSKEAARVINVNKLYKFSQSPLASRMATADENGSLYKERQFVFGVKANELNKDYESDELILIQGIIDVFFEEEDGIVLVDYKTDYVEDGQEEILLSRYQAQFKYYKKALEQITGKVVKEMILYSFSLSKGIPMNDKD